VTSSPRKTVLMAIAYHDRLNGAQLGLLEIARNLPARGYRPILVTLGDGRATRAFRESGIDVRVLNAPAAFGRYNKAWLERGILWKLGALARGLPKVTVDVCRMIRDEEVALVHVNEPRSLLIFGWGAKLARRPLVLHARGSMRGIYPKLLWQLIQRMPAVIIRDGDAIKSDINPKLQWKVRVVYEAPYTHTTRARSPRTASPRPAVLTVASYIPYKGYHHLIAAIPLVNEEVGDHAVRFLCVGQTLDEPYAQELRSRIHALAIPNVELHDWTPEIDANLRNAVIYVQPTVNHETIEIQGERREIRSAEGIPRSVMEALSYGVPVVASDVGSMGEAVIDVRTGVLVAPGDHAALAAAVTRLLKDPEERARLGQEGSRLVARKFTLDACVDAVARIYAESEPQVRKESDRATA
jgi:glycosyltransferase involved in cell wall biosynthesis